MNYIFSKGITVLCSFRYKVFCNSISKYNSRSTIFPFINTGCPTAHFHSSESHHNLSLPFKPQRPPKIKDDTPVDWLPFQWQRRPKHNPFEDSGDLVKELEYDPSWPKPDFELSDELKNASDDVKHMFSLACASKMEIREVIKRNILRRVQRHPNDFDSLEVKIALQTITIRALFEHGREFKRDKLRGRKILNILIKKRNRSLKELMRMDKERFNWLTQELKLEYTPQRLGGRQQKYSKKWDLRRLTTEYSAQIIKDKKVAYHEELKQKQADFLKEKEEILAWIEKEEKELAELTI